MIQPKVFREDRISVLHELIQENPFATLVSMQEGEIVGDHIPMVLQSTQSKMGVLQGHIAGGNPIGKKLDDEVEVLVIFQGLHHYISPSWYPSKQEHERVVPTWNYVVAHAKGCLKLIRDKDWKLSHLNDLTNAHEREREKPWRISDAPDEFITRQMSGILGLEIDITSLHGTCKVSQNKNSHDYQGVIDGLNKEGSSLSPFMKDLGETNRLI